MHKGIIVVGNGAIQCHCIISIHYTLTIPFSNAFINYIISYLYKYTTYLYKIVIY